MKEQLDHLVRRIEAPRELLHQAERDLAAVGDHLLERRAVDEQAPGVLQDDRRGRARLVVEDGHLAHELPAPQRRQRPLDLSDALEDLHDARLDDVHLLAALALAKEHVTGAKFAAEAQKEWVRHSRHKA